MGKFSGRKWKWDKTLEKIVEIGVDDQPQLAPNVQDDTIPPTVSHATEEGLVFTSLSKLKEHYKQHGFEMTGGDHFTGKGIADWKYKADREDLRRDVEKSLNKIKWGMAPISEKERELCKSEEREFQAYRRRREA